MDTATHENAPWFWHEAHSWPKLLPSVERWRAPRQSPSPTEQAVLDESTGTAYPTGSPPLFQQGSARGRVRSSAHQSVNLSRRPAMPLSSPTSISGDALSDRHPSESQRPSDSTADREIERHILRRVRRLDDASLAHLLAELRSLSAEARHA